MEIIIAYIIFENFFHNIFLLLLPIEKYSHKLRIEGLRILY
jgi:hypothetical protein